MWSFLIGCAEEPAPAAFDWGWDRTRVAAIRVWPLEGEATLPRTIDALVISPSSDIEVRVELCGYDPEIAAKLWTGSDLRCFDQPDLVEVIGDSLPIVWTAPEASWDCPLYSWAPPDSGLPEWPWPLCSTWPLLRVVVSADGGPESSAVATPGFERDPYDPRDEFDLAGADPRLEVVDGTLGAGGKVLVRFSVAPFYAQGNPEPRSMLDPYGYYWTEPFPDYEWYFEAGEPYGTGVTGPAGVDESGRPYAQTWLKIPDDWHGPLRVAAVRGDLVPVWAQTTLEVP